MADMITKPDANPILYAVLNLFLWGCVGYFLMGQTKKAIITAVLFWLTVWFGIGALVAILAAYDAYLLGQKLQRGESITPNETLAPGLNLIPMFKD